MKKLIFLLAIAFGMLASVNVQAQVTVYTMSGSDTVVNTATVAVTQEVKNYYNTITLQAKIVKVSGTVAGTVTVQGSLDGNNYETIDTNLISNSTATYTATNVTTNSEIFVITGTPYRYFRISYTGSGTMAAILSGYLHAPIPAVR